MMLFILLLAPLVAAGITFLASGKDGDAAFRLSFALAVVVAILGLPLVIAPSHCWAPVSIPWFGLWGTKATVHLGLGSDGLSAWLVQLVTWLTPLAILGSRRALGAGLRDFAAAVLLMESLMIGALLATDVVVFYLCYEGMLVPMLVLIALFGGPERKTASLWFFIYTMLGSVFMLVGIWYLAWKLGTTDLTLLATRLAAWRDGSVAFPLLDVPLFAGIQATPMGLLFLGFLLAFAVKVPLVPLHSWQAQTYAEAPAGAAMLLAGVMAKIGVYGLLRILLPLFPQQVAGAADIILVLGLIGVVGGALVALAQDDAKRMLAWSSLSHLSLVVIGVFSLDPAGLTGVPVQMIAHGLSVAALFLLIGHLEARAAVRGLDDFGGLAERAPRLAVLFVIAALASAGLPGTANFVGEFLLLLGAFRSFGLVAAAIAGLAVILGAVYLLRVVQRWMYGARPAHLDRFEDLGASECLAVVPLLALALIFGFYPRPIIAQTAPVLQALSAASCAVKNPPQPDKPHAEQRDSRTSGLPDSRTDTP